MANQAPQYAPRPMKLYFTDPETGGIRWGMTALAWIVGLGVGLMIYIKVRDSLKKVETTNRNSGGGPLNNSGGTGGGSTTPPQNPYDSGGITNANQTPQNYANAEHQKFVNALKENLDSYTQCYLWKCNDANGKCANLRQFLGMSEPDQKAVANLFQRTAGKKMYDYLDAWCACDCTETSGTTVQKVRSRLVQLGLK
jgi:hypothetical protein